MKIKSLTLDAATLKGKFNPSTAAERQFYKSLRRVAQLSGHIVETYVGPDKVTITNTKEMQRELERYSKRIGPWAERQSKKLLEQVARSNKRAYQAKSKAIGVALNMNIAEQNVLVIARALQAEQVALIKSIPIEAGYRAHSISFEAATNGQRAVPDPETIEYFKTQMEMTTEVAESRAKLIAITETARANASINQARATSVGSARYRWHNSGDGAVRHSHRVFEGRAMQGRIFSWDDPPTLSDGMKGHPGTFPRCRCFAEPIFDA